MRFSKSRGSVLVEHKDKMTLLLLVLSIFIGLFNSCSRDKEYVLFDGKNVEAPELESFCSAFIDQIINKSLHRQMVEPDIYEVLTQDNYSILKLVGSEKSLYSRSTEEECSVIVKDQLGLRRFDIRVNKSTDYPFYYRVQKIDEPRIEG
jgi:hypothetical protein